MSEITLMEFRWGKWTK